MIDSPTDIQPYLWNRGRMNAYAYLDIFGEALRRVSQRFYKVTTTYKPSGIVRERVFCYELYHQMRLVLGNNLNTPASLHAEIDKRGHHDFLLAHRTNPDFIVHVPGTHINNTIVVEVKGKMVTKGIKKDLRTLLQFVETYHYQLGLFILYNHSLEQFSRRMRTSIREEFSTNGFCNRVFVMCLKNPSFEVEVTTLRDLLE